MNRVFLTGASGFVGASILRQLVDQGVSVAALVSPDTRAPRLQPLAGRFTAIEGRLADLSALRERLASFAPDAFIHAAWYTEPGKYLTSPINTALLQESLGTIQACIDIGCPKFIGIGTCAEYDTDVGYLREDSPTRPATLYAACKLALCLIGQQMAAAAGVRFAWGRIFYLYGDDEDPRRLVPALIRALRAGQPFDATAGEQVRDYLHVRDVANGLITLARTDAEGIYNIASGHPVSIREFMETIGELAGGREHIRFGALPYRPWEPMFICGDNRRLRALGWAPAYSLREGLLQAIRG